VLTQPALWSVTNPVLLAWNNAYGPAKTKEDAICPAPRPVRAYLTIYIARKSCRAGTNARVFAAKYALKAIARNVRRSKNAELISSIGKNTEKSTLTKS
jgi:hypothetical protein